MNDDLKLRGMRDKGTRFFIRDYDAGNEEYIFGTTDPEQPEVRLSIDKGNPRRGAMHGTLMDVIGGRLGSREGLRMTLGAMPQKRGRDGENPNAGKLQIVDMAEIDLPTAARKVVRDGKVIGDWSKELDRSVNRFADTVALDKALDSMVAIGAAQLVYEDRILKRAREIALSEIKCDPNDVRFSLAELDRVTARSFQEALLGCQQVVDEPGAIDHVRYNPLVSLESQNEQFARSAERLRKNVGAKASPSSQSVASIAMNYAIQRAIVLEAAEQCLQANVVKDAEERLQRDGQLLYGHPKRSAADYKLASQESGLLMGSEALAGMMHLTVGSKLKGLGDGEVAFHREVMEELDALPQFQKLSPTEKFDAYTLVCTERLDRYSFRERMAVYEEQIKAAAPERKQDVKKPDPEVDQANEERSKAIRGLAATALKGAHHSHQFMENIEGVGSMSL